MKFEFEITKKDMLISIGFVVVITTFVWLTSFENMIMGCYCPAQGMSIRCCPKEVMGVVVDAECLDCRNESGEIICHHNFCKSYWE